MTNDVSSKTFDDIRFNKITFFEFQEWMEEQSIAAWEDGYHAGYVAAQAAQDFMDSANG